MSWFTPQVYDSEDPALPSLPQDGNLTVYEYKSTSAEKKVISQLESETHQLPSGSHSKGTERIIEEDDETVVKEGMSPKQSEQNDEDQLKEKQPEHHLMKKPSSIVGKQVPNATVASDFAHKFNDSSHKRNKLVNRKITSSGHQKSTMKPAEVPWNESSYVNSPDVRAPGCTVTIADYSDSRYRVSRRDMFSDDAYQRFIQLCSDSVKADIGAPGSFKSKVQKSRIVFKDDIGKRPDWASVRWINVNGLERHAFIDIMEHFKLSGLAVQELLSTPDITTTDTLNDDQLYFGLTFNKLVDAKKYKYHLRDPLFRTETLVKNNTTYSSGYSSSSENGGGLLSKLGFCKQKKKRNMDAINYENATLDKMITNPRKVRYKPAVPIQIMEIHPEKYRRSIKLMELKNPLRRLDSAIGLEYCGAFLLENNTVITFFEHSGNRVESDIFETLGKQVNNLMANSKDASVLFVEILDGILDNYDILLGAYEMLIYEYRMDIMALANLKYVQELNLMSDDLNYLYSALTPIISTLQKLKSEKLITSGSQEWLNSLIDNCQMYQYRCQAVCKSVDSVIGLSFNTVGRESSDSMNILG
ncbi:unnamed protein product [Ambrosiozyma monospora]|uniref:Unnamed protein product n=1 Tax=Ambrosiozyma monospora TaxID=43982 RepID=A0A9W7DKJ4_AMBMO|nr:unnamed protein product [Ambrosiozyma monospora]